MFIKSYDIPWAFNNCDKLLYAYDVYKHQESDIFHQISILDSILISKMLFCFLLLSIILWLLCISLGAYILHHTYDESVHQCSQILRSHLKSSTNPQVG